MDLSVVALICDMDIGCLSVVWWQWVQFGDSHYRPV